MTFQSQNSPSDRERAPGHWVRIVYNRARWARPLLHDCNSLAHDLAADWSECLTQEERIEIVKQYQRMRNQIIGDGLKLTIFESCIHASILTVLSWLMNKTPQFIGWIVENPISFLVVIGAMVSAKKIHSRK